MVLEQCAVKLLYGKADDHQSVLYYFHAFTVPSPSSRLSLTLDMVTEHATQIPVALFSPDGRERLVQAPEGGKGHLHESWFLTEACASPGGIPGIVEQGIWKLVLYKRRFDEDITCDITIDATALMPVSHASFPYALSFPSLVKRSDPGWYCGELHVHSDHSTGRDSVHAVLDEAERQGLDFIALTDHFTASHWLDLEKEQHRDILCLRSMEISGERGHANVHGVREWINPFVDGNEELARFLGLEKKPTMESIADTIHAQGGLFCLNHTLSGLVSWRYHEFPVEKADLFEIWCLADGPTSFLYPVCWDMYLHQGLHLVGVGSSDSHKAKGDPVWQLGNIRTWVYAGELSQKGILDGLKSGRAYVSYGDSRLDFSLTQKGQTIGMGGICDCEEEMVFKVTLSQHPRGNLFIIVDGQIHDILAVPASARDTVHFVLHPADTGRNKPYDSYVRLEFHEELVKAKYYGMAYRDASTMRLLSNPIWIHQGE